MNKFHDKFFIFVGTSEDDKKRRVIVNNDGFKIQWNEVTKEKKKRNFTFLA